MTLLRLMTNSPFAYCLLVASVAGWDSTALAQPRIDRSLARKLGESSEGAERLIWLSLPPQSESLLGAVVTPTEKGFAVVDRLPREAFDVKETWKAEHPVQDIALPKAESPLVHAYLKGLERPTKSYAAIFEADNVKLHAIVPKTPDTVEKFLANSQPTRAAANAGKKLYFVRSAYEGVVQLRFAFKERAMGGFVSARSDFKLAPPAPDGDEVELTSDKAVEFAYQFDAVNLPLDTKPTAANVALTPAPPPEIPSLWEAEPRPRAAMAPPDEGPEENFYRVNVFYASNRNFGPTTAEWRRKAFVLCFLSYFLTLPGGGLAGGCLLIAGVLAIVPALRKKLGAIGLVAALLLLLGLPFAVAGIFAAQNYEATTAMRGDLSYGTCDVSIPRNHKAGTLDQPVTLFLIRIEPENPEEHVVLLKRESLEQQAFFSALDVRLQQSPQQECFVFLHGYNNSFDDAAKRTAQLWYDLKFPGAPIFFSWPSQGSRAGYTFDENNATWAQADFQRFVEELHTRTKARRIHIIAHSMGNRILADTMEKLAAKGTLSGEKCRIQEIVLAAPDIDADTLRRIAPRFTQQKPHVTLYASKNDAALQASWTFHDYPRAGDTTNGIVLVTGMDSIDASLLDTSLDTHGYIAAQPTVVLDLLALMQGKKTVERAWLEEATHESTKYWIFRPD